MAATPSSFARRITSVKKPGKTGPRAIVPSSVSISPSGMPVTPSSPMTSGLDMTTWYLMSDNGQIVSVEAPGGDGRISWSNGARGNGELRVYRDATTKVYDGVFSNVRAAWSDKVTVRDWGKTPKAEVVERLAKEREEKVSEKLATVVAETIANKAALGIDPRLNPNEVESLKYEVSAEFPMTIEVSDSDTII